MRAVTSLLLSFCVATAMGGCKEDPAIVIRFDAPDLAGSAGLRLDAAVAPRPGAPDCEKDVDCGMEVDGCCDCANGGKQRAVSKKHPAVAPHAPCDSLCTMMISTDPSCSKRPVCVGGSCVLRDPPAETKPRSVLPNAKPTR